MKVITQTVRWGNGVHGTTVTAESGGQTLLVASISLTEASRLSHMIFPEADFAKFQKLYDDLPPDEQVSVREAVESGIIAAADERDAQWSTPISA